MTTSRTPAPLGPHARSSWQMRVRFRLPVGSVEVLERITPLHPDLLPRWGQLSGSPATAYLAMTAAGADSESTTLVGRWPFRVVRPGAEPPTWRCLALIAHEHGLSVLEAARATADLEEARILQWCGERHVYAMKPDDGGVLGRLDALAVVDLLF